VKHLLTISGLWLLLVALLPAAERAVSFARDVAPILVAKCLACHNPEKAKGSYRLHSFDALMKAGTSDEPPIVPGRADQSRLYQLISLADEADRMPQKDEALPSAHIALIRDWINQGARFDSESRSTLLAVLTAPKHPDAPRTYPLAVPVTALAFEPSGERLAASGYHEITFWNSENGALERRIGGIAEKTFDLAFSHDGRWLAAASGTPGKAGEVRLFQGTNGELAAILATTPDAALCLAFSPDGKFLAAGGADNVVRVWDLETRKLSRVIEQHADWALTLAFSPDGSRLASGSRDKSVRVFNLASGELEETYNGHGDFVIGLGWPDAKSVLSAARTGPAHRWNAENAKKTGELSGWEAEPTRIVVDGTNAFSASFDRLIRHHVIPTNQVIRIFSGHSDAVQSLALHRTSGRLASGSHNGEVRLWRVSDGELLLRFVAAPGYVPKLSRP